MELHEVFLFEVFYALFVINDVDVSGTMVSILVLFVLKTEYFCIIQELSEFLGTLAALGRPGFDPITLKRMMADFDVDDSGTIDANEFSMIMVRKCYVPDIISESTFKSYLNPTNLCIR